MGVFMDRNTYLLLALLCLGLNRFYARNCLQPDAQLHDDLAGIMRSPLYNRGRDREFIISRITRDPGFMLDVFVLGSLLMTSAYLFYRAVNFERVRPQVQAQPAQNPVQENPVAPESQNVAAREENRAAFFQSPAGPSNADTANVSAPANDGEQKSVKKNK
jgi:hypothetical protein